MQTSTLGYDLDAPPPSLPFKHGGVGLDLDAPPPALPNKGMAANFMPNASLGYGLDLDAPAPALPSKSLAPPAELAPVLPSKPGGSVGWDAPPMLPNKATSLELDASINFLGGAAGIDLDGPPSLPSKSSALVLSADPYAGLDLDATHEDEGGSSADFTGAMAALQLGGQMASRVPNATVRMPTPGNARSGIDMFLPAEADLDAPPAPPPKEAVNLNEYVDDPDVGLSI